MAVGTVSHEYILGRDYLASARLNLQHYLWVQEVGYHLHPCIGSSLADVAIADVATGTGIWMTDLAQNMPSCTFHGFDVDLAQAPPTEWLPSNVRLDKLDLFQPLPEHYEGKFDIVHLRLLMCVIKGNPRPVLRNLIKMLKPQGFLQWGEMDHSTHRFEKARDELSMEEIARAGEYPSTLAAQDSRLDQRWITSLGEIFESEGLQLAANDHHFRDVSRLSPYQDVAFMMWEELKSKMTSPHDVEYANILNQARDRVQHAKRGLAINMEIRTVVGRRR